MVYGMVVHAAMCGATGRIAGKWLAINNQAKNLLISAHKIEEMITAHENNMSSNNPTIKANAILEDSYKNRNVVMGVITNGSL